MFENLLLHPRTKRQIENFVSSPSHGLILIGPEGAGKRYLAEAVASVILGIDLNKLNQYPYFSSINPAVPSITIEEIRSLQKLLTLRTPLNGKQKIRRVFSIIDAGRMRHEAQNSFLKSLEEPPKDTSIILTAASSGDLLETIYSRVQSIDVLPVSEAMASEFYSNKGIAAVELNKNYSLSQGYAGLLSSLLVADSIHPLKEWVKEGKHLLSKPIGERLLSTDELSRDKEGVTMLLNALNKICHAALMGAGKAGNIKTLKRWQKSLQAVQEAHIAMEHNANLKLLLDHLLLSL